MTNDDDETDKASEERRQKFVKAGVAVGIGSAAIVAALLYASTVKKKPKKKPTGASRSHRNQGTD